MKRYVMSLNVLSYLLNHNRSVSCHVCGLPLKIGEEVVSRQVADSRVHCHAKCFESLYVVC